MYSWRAQYCVSVIYSVLTHYMNNGVTLGANMKYFNKAI